MSTPILFQNISAASARNRETIFDNYFNLRQHLPCVPTCLTLCFNLIRDLLCIRQYEQGKKINVCSYI